MKLTSLDHLVLTVADVAATVRFYSEVLGMEAQVFGDPPRHALGFGRQKINLHPAAAPYEPKAARPMPGSADLCFLSDQPLAEWQAQLARHGVAVELGPVPRTGAEGPIRSLYLRDPDGNLIEIANPA